MKHTPGPWEVYEGHDGQFKEQPYILKAETNNVIAIVQSQLQDQQQANARLIAAAPLLLEACEKVAIILASQATTSHVRQQGLPILQQAIAAVEEES